MASAERVLALCVRLCLHLRTQMFSVAQLPPQYMPMGYAL